ncbi:PSD1 and planctomycete cytochrome C domain-containing protein [Paludisphaera rhizosphaerae]|uniref:PSD1 and planctomycete cytochrome C domain-containing protein n=1 Tax=Paludisphaera rhizosphaerae TaxID=2711216 RepID=UPI0013EA51D4|nr:PSD1 and planctomycete cytochrome C domain-containing protein [Paludisphaera rhizosphaerae]
MLSAALILLAASNLATVDEPVDFAHEVLPLLRERCASCHANGKAKGDLSMDTRETLIKSKVVVPGKSGESELMSRVLEKDPELRMPPKGPPLSEKQTATLRRWIDGGLVWQEGFSFAKSGAGLPIKPRKPELPPAVNGRTNPIDRIVDAYFAGRKVSPPTALDDAAFARRVWLDLVGLTPTPAELDAFLVGASPNARERLVRDLLDDGQKYAEHWLTFWNDLLRNDYEGTGYIDGGRKAITAWLYRSLRENKPYDKFVHELISPTPDSEGFIKGIKWRGVVNASQVPELQFAQNVGQVFLGLNLKCASCHDSFIDSWKLEDTYGLAAVIADSPLDVYRCDKPTGVKSQVKFLFPDLGSIDPAQPRNERLRRLADLLITPEDGLFARTIVNRLWHRLMGRGIVHPVDVMGNKPWSADLIDFLASDLVEHDYDLKRTLELIATSHIYASKCVEEVAEESGSSYVFRGPTARRMTAEQFIDAIWRITDTAPPKMTAKVERGFEPIRAALVVSDPLMRSLGRPNREQVVSTRPEDLSTLQALDLTNGQTFADLLTRGARSIRATGAFPDADSLVDWLYRAALSRRPTDIERTEARAILGTEMTDEGLADLLWTLFMLPEFQLIR